MGVHEDKPEDIPEDIIEARKILTEIDKAYRRTTKMDLKEVENFCKAMEILNKHLVECTDCQHKERIKSMKRAYTEVFIDRLEDITFDDRDIMCEILLTYLADETMQVLEECPNLREKFKAFFPDAVRIFEDWQRRGRKNKRD